MAVSLSYTCCNNALAACSFSFDRDTLTVATLVDNFIVKR